jgi:phage tail-like protein
MDAEYPYPYTGFHFRVDFLFPSDDTNYAGPIDALFKEVSGIGSNLEVASDYQELGNVHVQDYAKARKFSNLVLKRGVTKFSKLNYWFEDSLYDLKLKPIPVIVTLLNEAHQPAMCWLFYDAFPLKWSMGNMDAQENKILIETIELHYSSYISLLIDTPAEDYQEPEGLAQTDAMNELLQ